jgi:peptidoglycan hydrolase-like protein with peptidoglycan-binding domain
MPEPLAAAARRPVLAGLVLAAALALLVATAPAAGAATHTYGEMVDYPLIFPVAGEVHYTDTFYASRYNGQHHAQDLMADKMVPVVAVASGRIEFVNWSSNPNDLRPDNCCSLALRHDDGWQTYYIHLNNDSPGTDDGQGWGIAPGLRPGVHVQAGELIGWVGDSGNAESTSPHLHFELRDPSGVIVNPYRALRAAEGIEITPPVCSGGSGAPLDGLLGGTRLLRRGMSGNDVSELQGFLNLQNHEAGPVDGVFGRLTDQAVRAFQRAQDLNADGVSAPTPGRRCGASPKGAASRRSSTPTGASCAPGKPAAPRCGRCRSGCASSATTPGRSTGFTVGSPSRPSPNSRRTTASEWTEKWARRPGPPSPRPWASSLCPPAGSRAPLPRGGAEESPHPSPSPAGYGTDGGGFIRAPGKRHDRREGPENRSLSSIGGSLST